MKTDLVWRTERRKISELVPHQNNPRKMSEKQVADLTASIEKFNLVEIPAIDADNTIIAGHQRLGVMKLIGRGEEEIEVRVPSRPLTSEERDEYLIRSNLNIGEWDYDILANVFDEKFLIDIGFNKFTLKENIRVNDEIVEDNFDAESEAARIANANSKRGQIYQLGPHRLMCGDSVSSSDLALLMNGAKANMVFTDPPYNIDYSYGIYKSIKGSPKKKMHNDGHIFNDKKTDDEFEEFLLQVFSNAFTATTDDAAFYCCHSTSTQDQFISALRRAGYHLSQTLIWRKERTLFGAGVDFLRIYEPIFYGWKEGKPHYTRHMIPYTSPVRYWL